MDIGILADPSDQTPAEAIEKPSPSLLQPVRGPGEPEPVGITEEVIRMAGGGIYPVLDGIPVLLRPEQLHHEQRHGARLSDSRFAGAYGENALYSSLAEGRLWDMQARDLTEIFRHVDPDTFPRDMGPWMTASSTGRPYELSMQHLGCMRGATVLQLGGTGSHALKMLHAGAERAVLISPILAELVAAKRLAERLGVSERMVIAAGMAEELPILDGVIDVAYAGSSMHHTDTELGFGECARVLRAGGRFASVDVWKGSFHSIGTTVFGKRHGANCRPFDGDRILPALSAFDKVAISYHGGLARYPLAVLARAGIELSPRLNLKLSQLEDAIPLGPLTRPLASIVCVRGEVG